MRVPWLIRLFWDACRETKCKNYPPRFDITRPNLRTDPNIVISYLSHTMAQSYIAVPEDEEKLLSTLGSEDGSIARSDQSLFKTISLTTMLHWTAHISTLILVAILLVRQTNGDTSNSSGGNHELYSPAFGNSQRPLHYEVFRSAFWQNTIYKAYPGPPSNKTLAAWNHITDTPAMNLTADEISRLGLSTDSVQWPKSTGGGYIAFLESAHQLHCLQSLWMRHHYDKNPDLPIYAEMREKIESMPDIEEAHFEHCVDVIRYVLRRLRDCQCCRC